MPRNTSVALIRRFIEEPCNVPIREALEALADPSPAVDQLLEGAREDWWSFGASDRLEEEGRRHADLCKRIPAGRWLWLVYPANLYDFQVGPVPRAVAPAFARWLLSYAGEVEGSSTMASWALRRDIFDDAGALDFLRVAVADQAGARPGDRAYYAEVFLARGGVDEGMRWLADLPQEEVEAVLRSVPSGPLTRWLHDQGDRVETDGFTEDVLAVISVLIDSQDHEALDACLAAIERALDDDLAADLLFKLSEAFGLVIEPPFRERRPWDGGEYDSASETMRLALDALAKVPRLRAVLVGEVRTRPKGLNGIGTSWRPSRIPVVLDGRIVGRALRARYPDPSSLRAEFEVELDATAVPPEWRSREVTLDRVDQRNRWPGPPPIRVVVTREARVGARQQVGRAG